jgi:monoamine oxidase
VSYVEVLEKKGRWRPLLDQWIGAVNGVDPEEASTLDHANYRDTGENWPVRDGYGALVARHGAGVPVELETAADRIDWGGKDVRVETRKGVIVGKGAILTVSTGVLASGLICFDPILPEWKASAIDAVPMGKANKVAFSFSRDVFDLPEDSSATMFAESSKTLGFQIKHFGRNIAIGYLGGRFSSELESAGKEAMRDFAMEQLKGMFGSDIDRNRSKWIATSWEGDPFIRGGYSAARPGEGHRRADLATPVGDRLFFAGEATSKEFFSTVHGAYYSGIAAARQAASTLGFASAPQSEEVTPEGEK